MMGYFIIKAKLPSMNEFIGSINRNRHIGNRFKQEIEELIGWSIKQAVFARTLKPFGEQPCIVLIEWHEKTKRRDADNIQSSQKFILDALQKQRVIKRDSRRYVKQIYHEIIDDTEDFVKVRLEPVGSIGNQAKPKQARKIHK